MKRRFDREEIEIMFWNFAGFCARVIIFINVVFWLGVGFYALYSVLT